MRERVRLGSITSRQGSALRRSFGTWSYHSDQPLSLRALREITSLFAVACRAKGVVYTSDAPERRAILQVVGKRVDISLEDEWGERPRRTQIVLIGTTGGMALVDHMRQLSQR